MSDQTKVLIDEREFLVLRLNGIPRDPVDGRHRRLVVYASPTLGSHLVARLLRQAADRLEDRVEAP